MLELLCMSLREIFNKASLSSDPIINFIYCIVNWIVGIVNFVLDYDLSFFGNLILVLAVFVIYPLVVILAVFTLIVDFKEKSILANIATSLGVLFMIVIWVIPMSYYFFY